MATGYLGAFSQVTVDALVGNRNRTDVKEPEILTVITKPLTNLILQIDKKVLDEAAVYAGNGTFNKSVLKHDCPLKDGDGNTIKPVTIVPCKFGLGFVLLYKQLVLSSYCAIR